VYAIVVIKNFMEIGHREIFFRIACKVGHGNKFQKKGRPQKPFMWIQPTNKQVL
jgi:hypothetical protein